MTWDAVIYRPLTSQLGLMNSKEGFTRKNEILASIVVVRVLDPDLSVTILIVLITFCTSSWSCDVTVIVDVVILSVPDSCLY